MTDAEITPEPAPPEAAADSTPQSAPVDPRLLEVLVCPVTRGPLEYDRARGELISRGARLAYPIRDGVPIMLPEEARELGEGE
ncbi:Trm112 family protein [Caulobacter sp. KR2-114]|uniref:Trm112 family protein n=1 Tax=Caulobacter sp. KR2-114 TaxID=3400912 RepID=UPI003C04C29B